MPATGRAIGTLLYLGSIDVNSAGETKMLQLARSRGWNVLACSIGLDYMAPEKIVVDDGGSTRLARRIDDHLADRAYAMEALLAYLQSHRSELLVGPRVIVGMSAGAIAVPTVVARIGPVDAAVVIGGGENVAEIIANSPLFSHHIELVDVRLEASPKGDRNVKLLPCENPQKRAEFVAAVLHKSKIDPRHVAAALQGTPVLMVQAKYDDIVPAAAGRSMYESLDRPERWQYRTGHIGLTLLMPWKIDYVLDWMTTHAAG
jgi:pimeloyl-ACP methyl ester carboxylesterase